jgi:VWFA-related protein
VGTAHHPGRELVGGAHPAKRLGVAIVTTLLLLAPRLSRAQGAGPPDEEISAAITRGVDYLKSQQEPAGNWSFTFNHDHALGITALAGLALLENGVPADDPAIGRAAEAVRGLATRSELTYDLALSILFLARVQQNQPGRNDALIRRLAGRLAGGQGGGGMWTYTVPIGLDEEDGPPGAGTRRRGRPTRRRPAFEGDGDNSNTQFALLGVWAAGRHGFDANGPLEEIDAHFRRSQRDDGRWGYVPGDGGKDAMTCAGLMGLAVAAARPALAERQTARARGAALAADPAFAAALRAVALDARGIDRGSDIYYLWSLERVCVALGLRDLEGLDWYATGARELLRRQHSDGSWPAGRWGVLPNSCLALLFLRKANLAFELDRVLKLPLASGSVASRGPKPDAPEADPAPIPDAVAKGDDGSTVVVTGASDAAFPEIAVDFEVKRPDGSFVLDARREDLRVTEDGREVEVLRLLTPAGEARPITVVLVVDRSLSMEEEDRIGGLKRAVATFLRGLPRGSRVAVIAFGSEVQKVCPFTDDFARVQETVDGLSPAGATRYYDAVAESLELLRNETGRRAVLALTDGEDTFSQSATLDTVVAAARRLGLPVHTLGLGSEDEIESDALRRLATSTRGQYYPARQADQLRTIYQELAERLRSSFTLIYKTDRVLPDGTLRPVRVSYRTSRQAGETAVFIPGMVVPAPGWSRLFLVLVVVLGLLSAAPGLLARRRQGQGDGARPVQGS